MYGSSQLRGGIRDGSKEREVAHWQERRKVPNFKRPQGLCEETQVTQDQLGIIFAGMEAVSLMSENT